MFYKKFNTTFQTFIKTMQKSLKFDTKEFETMPKTAPFKNTTLELCVSIVN